MKILMILGAFDVGGAESHVESLSLALDALGHEVCVLSRGGESSERLAARGIRQRRLSARCRDPLSVLSDAIELYRAVKEESPDVVHAHTRFEAALARTVCARFSVPLVTTAHALFSMTPIKAALSFWGDATIAVSEDIKAHLLSCAHLDPQDVSVIENGVFCPEDEFAGAGAGEIASADADARGASREISHKIAPKISHEISRKIAGDPTGSKRGHTLLFMSRLDGDCSLGAELLCEIAPRLRALYPDAAVIISGGGSELSRITAQAERANRAAGAAVVRTTGRVNPSASLFEGIDLFVGVSRAAMEALAAGTPTVLLGNEGFLGLLTPDLLEEARSSNLCCRGSKKADAERLLREIRRYFSLSEQEKSALSRFSAETARRFYSADEMARRAAAIYRKVIDSRVRLSITICGYSGFGNLGDDAILCSTLERLARCKPAPKISVICGKEGANPCGARDSTVSRVGFFDLLGILRALIESEVFIFGGGSLLQNKTSDRSLVYYLALIGAARALCKKTVLLANGFGPVKSKMLLRAALSAINSFDIISVRDGQTRRRLMQAIPKRDIFLFPDPAILLCADPAEKEGKDAENSGRAVGKTGASVCAAREVGEKIACLPVENSIFGRAAGANHTQTVEGARAGVGGGILGAAAGADRPQTIADGAEKGVGGRYFVFSPCADELRRVGTSLGKLAELLSALSALLCARPVVVVMDRASDARLAARLARAVADRGGRSLRATVLYPSAPEEARDILAGAHLCLSMRYHASLFAAAAGVPVLQIGGDPKLFALSLSLCLDCPVPARSLLSPSRVLRLCRFLLASSPKNSEKRRAAVQKYRDTCDLRFRELINYLNSLDFRE